MTGIAGLENNPDVATWAGLALLVSGALTVTLIPVLEGLATPTVDVVAYFNKDRQVVPGPAQAALVDEPEAPASGVHTTTL